MKKFFLLLFILSANILEAGTLTVNGSTKSGSSVPTLDEWGIILTIIATATLSIIFLKKEKKVAGIITLAISLITGISAFI